ncbi:MAG: hypothetical protein Q8T09_12285 [Candidatus Melainabacteria bacterium]|nr:hypothetical protein [Candidatus Melainabacteria bacterium]
MGPFYKIKPAASTIGAACRIGNFAVESFAEDNLAVGDLLVENGLRRSFSLWHHAHHQGRKPDSAVN